MNVTADIPNTDPLGDLSARFPPLCPALTSQLLLGVAIPWPWSVSGRDEGLLQSPTSSPGL